MNLAIVYGAGYGDNGAMVVEVLTTYERSAKIRLHTGEITLHFFSKGKMTLIKGVHRLKEDLSTWGGMVNHPKGKIVYEFDMHKKNGKVGVVDKDGYMSWIDWGKLEELYDVHSVI